MGNSRYLFFTSPCHPSLADETLCKSPSFFSEAARTDGIKVNKGWAELAWSAELAWVELAWSASASVRGGLAILSRNRW